MFLLLNFYCFFKPWDQQEHSSRKSTTNAGLITIAYPITMEIVTELPFEETFDFLEHFPFSIAAFVFECEEQVLPLHPEVHPFYRES